MSNFWDNIIVPSNIEVKPVETTNFWASIGIDTKPVKQSKPKAIKNKTIVQVAEKIYDTIDSLVVPTEDCKHYWIIPSVSAWAIGVCKLCNGEKWFSNRFKEESVFNDTLVPTIREKDIKDTLKIDADIRDITKIYNDSIEEGA